jgi:hypothetical protein
MIFGHYRELVRAMDAEKWFGLTPEVVEAAKAARQSGAAEKIVALPSGGGMMGESPCGLSRGLGGPAAC